MSNQEQKKLITIEDFYNNSTMGAIGYEKLSKNHRGVLTLEEARQRAERLHYIDVVSSREDKVFFFTDIYGFGYKVSPKHWGSSSTAFPFQVVPRKGLEDGLVNTIENFIFIYHKDKQLLSSIDELLSIINS